jgi:DUF4097 and DUF4098 domain-containing protein YvlB
MSSYPPPPPPPPAGSGYGPGAAYDRRAWKEQRRLAKFQARMARTQVKAQRAQMRMQQRSLRRGSLVGPLVLLGLGVVLLLDQTGRLSWAETLAWYSRWWPAVLIVAGIVLMIEWMLDQQRQEETGYSGTRVLGAGVVFLLILLAGAGWSARWLDTNSAWKPRYMGHDLGRLDRVFGDAHESDESVSQAIPAGAALVVHNPWGDVSVTGSSDDGQVHVSAHKRVYAWRDSDAETKASRMLPTFSMQGSNLMLDVRGIEQGQADLMIEVPRATPVSVTTEHGDVRVSEMHAAVTIAAKGGDLDVSGVNGPVLAHIDNDDASVAARGVTGSFTLQGRAGDISLSNIDGSVMLQGDFFGSTRAEKIGGPLRFETSRTRLATAGVAGDLQIERGDMTGNQLLGPVTLTTHDRTITLDDVAGPVQISNRNGAISITSASPLGPVDIVNAHGSVDLGVPGSSGFVLDAQAKNGNLENDFDLEQQEQNGLRWLAATVGGGGPKVRVVTTDGDVTVRKSIEPPVPPKPPAAPKISRSPQAPAVAVAPRAPVAPESPAEAVPTAPAAPAEPAAPAAKKRKHSELL